MLTWRADGPNHNGTRQSRSKHALALLPGDAHELIVNIIGAGPSRHRPTFLDHGILKLAVTLSVNSRCVSRARVITSASGPGSGNKSWATCSMTRCAVSTRWPWLIWKSNQPATPAGGASLSTRFKSATPCNRSTQQLAASIRRRDCRHGSKKIWTAQLHTGRHFPNHQPRRLWRRSDKTTLLKANVSSSPKSSMAPQ